MARRSVIVLWDSGAWLPAVAVIVATRYELSVGTRLKLYRGKHRVGTFEETQGLMLSMTVVALVLIVVFLVGLPFDQFLPGVAFLASPLALLLMAAARWLCRALITSRRPHQAGAENVLIYAAGDVGYQLLRLMQRDTASPYHAVGLIDDNPAKRHLTLLGTRVLGRRAELVEQAQEHDVSSVVLTISRASSEMIHELEGAEMPFFLLPPVSRRLGGRMKLSDVKEVAIADILGRRQVDTEIGSIAGYLTDKRVLVPGAGGSIGSEFAHQVHKLGPAELILLDHDEPALHGVQLSIYGKVLLDTSDLVLGSIRESPPIREVFEDGENPSRPQRNPPHLVTMGILLAKHVPPYVYQNEGHRCVSAF